MIKKFLLFATLLISQNLIICADECSVFSCSQLSSETGKKCAYTGGTNPVCESCLIIRVVKDYQIQIVNQ